MSLLIDIRAQDWMTDAALRDLLAPHLPGVTIHCGPQQAVLPDVRMLATIQMKPFMTANLPNLELVQKLGAGVESMLGDPNMPDHVRVARLEPQVQADEIAQYCLLEILAHLRNLRGYYDDQKARRWQSLAPKRAAQTRVAVLGLGHIGQTVARLLGRTGFKVSGWSRSEKRIEGVACYKGETGLGKVLENADYVVAVLPSTPQTRHMICQESLALMQPGAVLINVGRGDLIEQTALLAALDSGHLGGAVLDVFTQEPLPGDHPFWEQKNLWITPHVSGWSLGEGLLDVARNYRRLVAGKPLLREIDRVKGY